MMDDSPFTRCRQTKDPTKDPAKDPAIPVFDIVW
jgi:hypothetical protein